MSVNRKVQGDVFHARGSAPIDAALTTELPQLTPEQQQRVVQLLEELGSLLRAAPER